MTAVLGLSASGQDSAAALVIDGEIVAAAREASFSRSRHDPTFPVRALEYCLSEARVSAGDVDYVACSNKPLLELERFLETHLTHAPFRFSAFARALPEYLSEKLRLRSAVARALREKPKHRVVFIERHQAQAAAAFFPSPFPDAAILTLDGGGEWIASSLSVGRDRAIEIRSEQRFPHSLGFVHAAFTQYLGFEEEREWMSLAHLGEPRFRSQILNQVVALAEDGAIALDTSCFELCQAGCLTSPTFHALFGGPPRRPEGRLEARHADIAASLQNVSEEILSRMVRHAKKETGARALCLAGRPALNAAANTRILREGSFEEMWIQPGPDTGAAAGAALFTYHQLLGHARRTRRPDLLSHGLLGPSYDDSAMKRAVERAGLPFREIRALDARLEEVADALIAGAVVGWFDGRLEIGDSALGARSVLADPRSASIAGRLQHVVKPFPCVVLAEQAHAWRDVSKRFESPYCLLAANDSTRLQTLSPNDPRALRGLLERFFARTGCPALVSADFDSWSEPLVCSPDDAVWAFVHSQMDLLCLGPFLVEQPEPELPRLVSPCCRQELSGQACPQCGAAYPVTNGIWSAFVAGSDGVTQKVRNFYEATPFPDYSSEDSLRALVQKSIRGRYAAALDRAIPATARVLEVGCGTGQLTNFLGLACRSVVGVDASRASLALGEGFRAAHDLQRVRFVHANLFQLPFPAESFDVVIAHGVVHHTADPERAVRVIAECLRPGGHLVLGVYNRWGRIATQARRLAFSVLGERAARLDPIVVRERLEGSKRRAWLMDQYRHPHETSHGFAETLAWLDRTGLELVGSVPALRIEDEPLAEDLFEPRARGTRLDHFLSAVAFATGAGDEGGYQVLISRRR
jgi:carbamoyltransferase